MDKGILARPLYPPDSKELFNENMKGITQKQESSEEKESLIHVILFFHDFS